MVNKINEATKGKLVIEILGGPEVISGFDQAQSVRRGVIDMSFLPSSFYEGLVTPAKMVLLASLTPAEEELENGLIDMLREAHAKSGLYLLGRADVKVDPQFILGLNVKISKPSDLQGVKMGVGGVWYEPASVKYGTTMVLIPLPESFTAVERGVVDGYAVPYNTFFTFGLHEALKYYIDHAIYRDNKTVIINLAKWNSIPEPVRNVVEQVYLDMFPELITDYRAINDKARQTIIDIGGELIQFSPADAKWFVDASYEAMWDKILESFPEDGPKYLELMRP